MGRKIGEYGAKFSKTERESGQICNSLKSTVSPNNQSAQPKNSSAKREHEHKIHDRSMHSALSM
jgi:hypothetical protein